MKNHVNRKCSTIFFAMFILLIIKVTAQSDEVVIIDSNFENKGGILASLPVSVPYVEINDLMNLQQALEKALDQTNGNTIVHLFTSTTENTIRTGSTVYTRENLSSFFNTAQFNGAEETSLLIYSCSLAKTVEGRALIDEFANTTGLNIFSSSSCTSVRDEIEFNYATSNNTVKSNLFN